MIAARHSVRSYSDREVPREIIDRIVDIALTAPSARNARSSGFMIIEDRSTMEAISQMRDSGSAFAAGAPCAIVVLGDTAKSSMWVENASISATFIQLAAVNFGLGSCWIQVNGRLRDKNDPSKGSAADYLRNLLGIKDGFEPLCVISLGYE